MSGAKAHPEKGPPLRILMVLDYYRPYVSGLSITVERLAEGLVERGHRVTVLTNRHRADLPAEETTAGVRILRAPVLARLGKAQVSPALVAVARREISGVDVLHLHAPLVPAVPLTMLARRRGTPILANYHCDLVLPPGPVNRVVEGIARWSQDFALDRAAVIVNSTEDYAKATPALAGRLDRFRGIFPPVPEPAPARATPRELRDRWKVAEGPVLLFAGRFAEEKGLPHLIAAFPAVRARFPKAALVLVGENRDVPGETVGRRLAPLLADPASGIVATGLVPDEEMAGLFALADVLVLPSTNSTESLGMIQLEAMRAGVPCVASDLPGVRQPVARTGMGELAAPGDPASLAAAIVRVLEAPEKYRSRREAAREIFSIENTMAAYEDAYRAAIASGRR